MKNYIQEIERLKKEKNALILAHYYQSNDIQDIADFIGDSYGLAVKAKEANADIIVFAGVHFMAETAKILNPSKKVLLPDLEAGCSLADACEVSELKTFKKKYPDHMVVSYINCSAAVKCESDIICTSGNALKIINSLPQEQKIIFAPDKNLGAYLNAQTHREMVLWNGCCHVHDQLRAEEIIKLKSVYPQAKLIAHPECNAAVLLLADFVGSTAAMLKFIQQDNHQSYVVATETGILHQMQKLQPNKQFHIVASEENCHCNDCKFMKLNTLEKLYLCLLNESPEINLSPEIIDKARLPIERMLELSL